MKNRLENKKIISLDFEGNGQQPPDIVEIGIAYIANLNEISKHKSWLVKPKDKITWQATKIHGIKNNDLDNCKIFEDIKDELLEELEDAYILAHNANVEINILARKFTNYNPLGVIDTLKISRKIMKDKIKSHSLVSLISFFNLENQINKYIISQSHRAEYDAIATGLIFVEFCKIDYEKVMKIIEMNNQTQLKFF